MRYTTFWGAISGLSCIALASLPNVSAAGDRGSAEVSGPARVVDGDTVEIQHVRIRLEGIDAPERAQRCRRAWVPVSWRCGRTATRALKHLVKGHEVRCVSRGFDSYNRMIATCFVDGQDINAAMVRRGHAWAFTKYSQTYVVEESDARRESRGVWRAKNEPPWEYRAKKWAASEQTAPEDCPIKGNISANGRIYHMPWSPWYKHVRVDTRAGERWFCSEADARAAGWRPVAAS